MKRFLKWFAIILFSLGLLFSLFLIFFTINEYKPEPVLNIDPIVTSKSSPNRFPKDLMIMTWNIGYCGLDNQTDFYMDGGTMSRPRNQAAVLENIQAIKNTISENYADIYLLQEVDKGSSRSFDIDQVNEVTRILPKFNAWYSTNFKVLFVPSPLADPIGRVHSGILTLSRYASYETKRYQLPGYYPWPVRVFHLKRCMTMIRIKNRVRNKDWCIINVHLSAYDPGGTLRKQQLDFVQMTMMRLYMEGNYVIIGGDWNSQFPKVTNTMFGTHKTAKENLFWVQRIPEGWTPSGWTWAYDEKIPTCRTLDTPYKTGDNFTTIIDGFLLSPNIKLVQVKGIDLKFKNSDHNPIVAHVRGM